MAFFLAQIRALPLVTHRPNAIIAGDKQHICGSSSKYANRNDTGNLVDTAFQLEWIADLEIMHIENVISVIGSEILAPNWLAAHFHQFSCNKSLCHRQYFDR